MVGVVECFLYHHFAVMGLNEIESMTCHACVSSKILGDHHIPPEDVHTLLLAASLTIEMDSTFLIR